MKKEKFNHYNVRIEGYCQVYKYSTGMPTELTEVENKKKLYINLNK